MGFGAMGLLGMKFLAMSLLGLGVLGLAGEAVAAGEAGAGAAGAAVTGATEARAGDVARSGWTIGRARTKITPTEPLWMGGFAARTRPSEGTLDDLWAQALVLRAADGGEAVLLTLDLVAVPKWLYEEVVGGLARRCGLERRQIRLAVSHTHAGPALAEALPDIYPMTAEQAAATRAYSERLGALLLETVERARRERVEVALWAGEGQAKIAVNRRTNDERKLEEALRRGEAPKGPSDPTVPVLAARTASGEWAAIVVGYAAHTSSLTLNYQWSADYAGVMRRELERRHAGGQAYFFQGCGSDQSAAPRGTVEKCERLGQQLAAAATAVLEGRMRPVAARLRTAQAWVALAFGAQPTAEELGKVAGVAEGKTYQARWARRLAGELRAGKAWARGYPEYPVQVWQLGADQLWIALGGEVCVDYALRFEREYGPQTWVNGYANDVMAYIPSRRLWEEGGYQAGAFEVYGLPATRWGEDSEERIASAVARLVAQVRDE